MLAIAAAAVVGVSAQAANGPNLSALRVKLAQASKLPQFVAPGPAFNASKAKGKNVWIIPTSSSIPIVPLVNAGTEEALKTVGVKVTNFTTKGTTSDWVNGMNQAIAQKADAIVLLSIDPKLLGPQIRNAQKAHIPIIWTFAQQGDVKKIQPNVSASVPLPFTDAMRQLVDWLIVDSKGKAVVKIIETAEVRQTPDMVAAAQDELKKQCPSCSSESVLNAPIPDWATRLGSEVRSSLIANQKINYVLPLYDGMEQFVLPAIRQVNGSGRVKSASFNGTPAVLKEIGRGIMSADSGQSNRWIGWATADQVLRVLSGVTPVADEKVPLRLWTKENISQATGTNTEGGYGTSYVTGYQRLWGVK